MVEVLGYSCNFHIIFMELWNGFQDFSVVSVVLQGLTLIFFLSFPFGVISKGVLLLIIFNPL